MPKSINGAQGKTEVNITLSSGDLEADHFIGDLTGNADTCTKATGLNLSTAGFVKTDSNGTLSVVNGDFITSSQAGHITANNDKVSATTSNISTAGAVLKSGNETIGGVKSFTDSIVGNIDTATKLFATRSIAGHNFDGSQNVSIASTDLTDISSVGSGAIITQIERDAIATNSNKVGVTSASVSTAGAVLKSGDESIGGVKSFTDSIVGNIDTATKLFATRSIAGHNFDGSQNVSIASTDLTDISSVGSGAIITQNERDAIATNSNKVSATTSNMQSAGAVVTTNVPQTIQGVKTFSSEIVGSVSGSAKSIASVDTLGFVRNKIVGDVGNFSQELQIDNGGELLTALQANHITANNDKPTTSAVNTLISSAVSTVNSSIATIVSAVAALPTTAETISLILARTTPIVSSVSALQAEVDTNKTIFHAVYNVGFTTGSSALVAFVPFNSTSESGGGTYGLIPTAASERVSFIAPYNGKIIRVGWRSETAMTAGSSNTLTVTLCEGGNGTEVPSMSNVIGTPHQRTASVSDDTTVFVNPSDWVLLASRTYALRVVTSSAAIDTVMTVVIEYTI